MDAFLGIMYCFAVLFNKKTGEFYRCNAPIHPTMGVTDIMHIDNAGNINESKPPLSDCISCTTQTGYQGPMCPGCKHYCEACTTLFCPVHYKIHVLDIDLQCMKCGKNLCSYCLNFFGGIPLCYGCMPYKPPTYTFIEIGAKLETFLLEADIIRPIVIPPSIDDHPLTLSGINPYNLEYEITFIGRSWFRSFLRDTIDLTERLVYGYLRIHCTDLEHGLHLDIRTHLVFTFKKVYGKKWLDDLFLPFF